MPAAPRPWLERARLPAAVGALSFVVGAWQPGPIVAVVDEELWLARSELFARALEDGRLSDMTAAGTIEGATMPGVTTMWLGTVARTVARTSHAVGLSSDPVDSMFGSAAGLRAAHLLMALVTAAAVALVVVLVRRLVGGPAAAVTGVLLAVEPFLASNGIVLHTDLLVALPFAVAFLALALACATVDLDGDEPPSRPSRRLLVLSGAATGLALLTKINAIALVPGLVPIGLWWLRSRRADGASELVSVLVRSALVWVAGLAGVVLLLWPALWLEPAVQRQAILDSFSLGRAGIDNFYRGEPTSAPGIDFYPVALAIRLSPWLVAAAFVGAAIGLRDRLRRPVTVCALLAPLPYLVAMSLANKKFDRYALPVVPFLALAAGIGLGLVWERWRARHPEVAPGLLRAAGTAGAVLLAVPVLVAAPYAHAWINPVVGTEQATEVITRGRGEGLEQAGQAILERERGRCDELEIAVQYRVPPAFPCGTLREPTPDVIGEVDYVVVYLNQRQRELDADVVRWAEVEGELVRTVSIDGVDHAWVYAMP
jgi:hypothetical protein